MSESNGHKEPAPGEDTSNSQAAFLDWLDDGAPAPPPARSRGRNSGRLEGGGKGRGKGRSQEASVPRRHDPNETLAVPGQNALRQELLKAQAAESASAQASAAPAQAGAPAAPESPASESAPVASAPPVAGAPDPPRPESAAPTASAPAAPPVAAKPEFPTLAAAPVAAEPESPAPAAPPVATEPESPAPAAAPVAAEPEAPTPAAPVATEPEAPAPAAAPVAAEPEAPTLAAAPVAALSEASAPESASAPAAPIAAKPESAVASPPPAARAAPPAQGSAPPEDSSRSGKTGVKGFGVAARLTVGGSAAEVPSLPVGAPDHLLVLLRELDRKLAQGDPRRCWAATRDALGLLTRYFAGLLPAAWRSLAAPPPETIALWYEGRSTSERVELILKSLEALGRMTEDPLARVLHEVFYDRGQPRQFTLLLGVGTCPQGMKILPEWFSSNPDPPETEEAERQLKLYLPVLQEWVTSSRRFFQDCDHRFETGSKFGQMELVVRWRDKLLRTGFTLRLREGRKSGSFPAPTQPGPAPLRQTPNEPAAPTQEAEELTRLIVSMLQREHTGAARPKKKVEVAEEKPPEPPPTPRMHHQVTYIGPDRSDAGRYSYRGVLEVILPDDSPVTGHVRASHPKVTIRPTSFQGSYARIDYWIDPSAVNEQQPEYLIIQTPHELRKLPLTMLLPSSKIPNLTPAKAVLMLLAPAVLGTAYVLFRFYYSMAKIKQYLLGYTTHAFQETYLGRQPVSLQTSGISALEVDVLPMVETTALFYLMLAVLVPLVTTKLFQRLPNRQQSQFGMVYLLGMTLPLIVMSVILTGPALSSRLFIHPELEVMSYAHQFKWFAIYNLSASIYLFLSVTGILDNWIKNGYVRLILPVVLFALFIASSFYLVYG